MTDNVFSSEIPLGCSMDAVVKLMSGKWTPHIIWALRTNGPTRFGELRRLMPSRASPKVMSERLRRMENDGIVSRREQPSVPPEVIYSLTARGRDLDEILRAMHKIAEKWGGAEGAGV